MWAVVAPYLVKLGISLAVTLLEKSGAISEFEADGVRAGTHVLAAVNNLKTYPEYPTGVNGQSSATSSVP